MCVCSDAIAHGNPTMPGGGPVPSPSSVLSANATGRQYAAGCVCVSVMSTGTYC